MVSRNKEKQEAHRPQLAHLSETATADMQMACNIFPILLWQGNGLNRFWDISLTRLKGWNFQSTISKKKVQIFFRSHLVHLLILSFKGFFFSTFSSGNHFVQQSRTILAILANGHKRNIDVFMIIIINIYWWYYSKGTIASPKTNSNNANWSTRKLFKLPYTYAFQPCFGEQSSYLWRHNLVVSNYW